MKQNKTNRKPTPTAKSSPTPRPAPPTGPSPFARALRRVPERLDFWLVFAAAWLLRLIYVAVAARVSPSFDITLKGLDQFTYQMHADYILGGDWLLRKAGLFYYSPIYAYYSALVYKIIGMKSFLALHLVQSVTGAFTCALGFALARTWLSRPAALLAGLFYMLLATWLFYEQELLHEGFMLLFYMVMLWGVRTAQLGRPWALARLALAGAFGMLAMIGRGNAALVLLALIPWILAATPALRPVLHPRLNVAGALAFCLGIALVFGPLMLRNRAVAGRWAMGMGNGKVLFYIGNNIEGNGEFNYTNRFQSAFDKANQEPDVYRRYFLEDLKNAPGHILGILVYKTYSFFATYDLPDNLNFQLGRRIHPMVRATPVQWEFLMPLGLVGLGLSLWRRRRDFGLLWLFTAVFAASLIVIIPIGRYRQPVMIPIAIFAAFAVEWAAAAWRARERGAVGAAAAAWAGLVFALWPSWHEILQPMQHKNGPEIAKPIRVNDYQACIVMALKRNRPEMAEPLLREGMAAYPNSMIMINCAFAVAQAKGDRTRMREIGEIMLANPPVSPEDALSLAEIYAQDGQHERARTLLLSLIGAKIEGGEELKTRAQKLLETLGPVTR